MLEFKLIAGAVAISAAAFWVYSYGQDKFSDGYAKAKIEQEISAAKEFENLTVAYKKLLAEKAQDNRDAESKIRELEEKETIITQEVIKYVEKTNCKRLGDDFVRLFNTIHGNANEAVRND